MTDRIPKVIHYCWFGGKPLTEDAKKCIASWKKYCPGYKIIRWDEKNFDLHSNTYAREAYDSKRWAFVTDYARLYIMYHYGGIYMDTDVELIKPLDGFLVHDAFSGFESSNDIPTGIMACRKGFNLFGKMLQYYNNRHFFKEDGSIDLTTNVSIITAICEKRGLKRNNSLQTIDGFTLYPNDVFCPKNCLTGIIELTENTVAIHHFSGSWLTEGAAKLKRLRHNLCSKYGNNIGNLLYRTVFVPYRLFIHLEIRKEEKRE